MFCLYLHMSYGELKVLQGEKTLNPKLSPLEIYIYSSDIKTSKIFFDSDIV